MSFQGHKDRIFILSGMSMPGARDFGIRLLFRRFPEICDSRAGRQKRIVSDMRI